MLAGAALTCRAGTADTGAAASAGLDPGETASAVGASGGGAATGDSFFDKWFAISDAAKEAQPHWMTPVITVTPRLEQEFRYDVFWQGRPNDVNLTNYGAGKGLEIIPTANTELIIGVPPYEVKTTPKTQTEGFADWPLLLKYRFVAENEAHGNYIVTGFLGLQLPTGSEAFTVKQTIIAPTLAAGKGWGTRERGFDIQTTLGIAIPTGNTKTLGQPVTWNITFQPYIGKFWPELEVNYTYFHQGPNDGKSQLALTGGLVLGRFELSDRMRLIFGGAYQEVVSSFKTFNSTWYVTGRLAF